MKRSLQQISKPPKDFCTHIDEEDEISARLCIRIKLPSAKPAEMQPKNFAPESPLILNIQSSDEKKMKLKALTDVSAGLSQQNAEQLKTLESQLRNLLIKETSAPVLIKTIETLSNLARSHLMDCSNVVEELLKVLRGFFSENSRIVAAVLNALVSISKTKKIDVESIMKVAKGFLEAPAPPSTKIAAMQLISSLSNLSNISALELLQTMYLAFLEDGDGRVRTFALKLFREMFSRRDENGEILNWKSEPTLDSSKPTTMAQLRSEMEVNLYKEAILALTDEWEEVRLEAMRSIWTLANRQKTSVVDDAFRKICNMVSDTSVKVRAEACLLLGTLNGVSTALMLQSLSKSLLKVADQLKVDPFDPTTSDGQQMESVKLSAKSKLIDSGANGAFIHGLEDEFMQVRDSAISAICELCHCSDEFALAATEFFVDMFNDEIDSVRINAILSLSKIGKVIYLSEDQLSIVLAILDDATLSVRLAVRELLQSIRLINRNSLQVSVNSLLQNLLKFYPEKDSILLTFKNLGLHHSQFVELLVEELLRLDPRFLMREPRLDDIYYVSILILVLNAAKENVNIIALLPAFVPKQYLFLKLLHPSLIPDLPKLFDASKNILQTHLDIGSSLPSMDKTWTINGISANFDWLKRPSISEFMGLHHGHNDKVFKLEDVSSRCTAIFKLMDAFEAVEAQNLVDRLKVDILTLRSSKLVDTVSFLEKYLNIIRELAGDVLDVVNMDQAIESLEILFLGLSRKNALHLALLRIYAHLKLILNQKKDGKHEELKNTAARLLVMVKHQKEKFVGLNEKSNVLLSKLSSQLQTLVNEIPKEVESMEVEEEVVLFELEKVESFSIFSTLKKSRAIITLPEAQQHDLHFNPIIPLFVHLEFTLENVYESSKTYILVKELDHQLEWMYPLSAAVLHPLKPSLLSSVSMDVQIPHHSWNHHNSIHLQLSVVLRDCHAYSMCVPISERISSKYTSKYI